MQNITFTIQDVFWLCAGIGVVIGLFKTVSSLNPKKQLDDHEERIVDLEVVNAGQSYLILKSLQALMRNAQTGNNTKELNEVSTELNDYLLKK